MEWQFHLALQEWSLLQLGAGVTAVMGSQGGAVS